MCADVTWTHVAPSCSAFFKSRAFFLLIGFLLIAVFIWYAGPYFAFGSYRPLETEFSRLVAIGADRRLLGRCRRCSSGCAPAAPATGWSVRCSQSTRREQGAAVRRSREAARALRRGRRPRSRSGKTRPQPVRPAVVRLHRRAGLRQDHGAGQFRVEVSARSSAAARPPCAASAARATATGGSPTKRCFSTPPAATPRRTRTRRPTAKAGASSSRCCAKYRAAPAGQRHHPHDQRAGSADAGRRGPGSARRRGPPSTDRVHPRAADPAAGLRDGHQVRHGRRLLRVLRRSRRRRTARRCGA